MEEKIYGGMKIFSKIARSAFPGFCGKREIKTEKGSLSLILLQKLYTNDFLHHEIMR